MRQALDVRRACDLEEQPGEERWLIEELWAERAVGIVGGEPKSCKSFLALDVAVAVASGLPCLRRFQVPRKGPVLLFAAEDALHVVKERLCGIAAASGLALSALDIFVITDSILRLDLQADQERLEQSVCTLRPRLLVLDPFVRLHRVDENVVSEVAPLLAYLRRLERSYGCAVLLVHHARKGAMHARQGQALRGSSELHAWGDSNLYLRRNRDGSLRLSVEHRAAAACEDIVLKLVEGDGGAAILEPSQDASKIAVHSSPRTDPTTAILRLLGATDRPLSIRELRAQVGIRTATLCDALRVLLAKGAVVRLHDGYRLPPDDAVSTSHPPPTNGRKR